MKKLTNDTFIHKARLVHGDRYIYNKVCYIHSKEKVIITCTIHGDFNQTPSAHMQGQHCLKCSKDHYKKTCMKRYGVESPIQDKKIRDHIYKLRLETNYKTGFWISPDDNEKWKEKNIYFRKVRTETEKSYKHHYNKINPLGLKRGKKINIDHIFSRKMGYINNIDPRIIGHWTNLRMLDSTLNKQKKEKSDKTMEQLMEDYHKYEKQ